jgi:hypothetical protein
LGKNSGLIFLDIKLGGKKVVAAVGRGHGHSRPGEKCFDLNISWFFRRPPRPTYLQL